MNTQSMLFKRFRTYVRNYFTRRALRIQLHQMSSRELDLLVRDVGIPSSDLFEEAGKPFWKVSEPTNACERSHQGAGIAVLARDFCGNSPAV